MSKVCNSRNCIHRGKVVEGKLPMSPDFETLKVRCYSNPTGSIRMTSRGTDMQKNNGFESKGLILLLICGFYAVILFIVARLLSYAASKILSPVKSAMFRVEETEMFVKDLSDQNNNSSPVLKFKREQQQRTRTFSHG
ncbi:uncharacterized protein LOC132726200 [Ruditapes philippinarum]|uniref:uncharacterized protein LOC132726200 n=1 Tax=Ruditapes philippinarum TaxID=129788 RepID=UPI00295AF5C8|nr:uncharacterized protein LOC132726200 [Ruditapes philippinarum]